MIQNLENWGIYKQMAHAQKKKKKGHPIYRILFVTKLK